MAMSIKTLIQVDSRSHAISVFTVLILMISLDLFKMDIAYTSFCFFVMIWVAFNARLLGYNLEQIRQIVGKLLDREGLFSMAETFVIINNSHCNGRNSSRSWFV